MRMPARIVSGLLGLSGAALANSAELLSSPASSTPEEVVITGDRRLLDLRTQMFDAEKRAYDLFNKFNDERRFDISCSIHEPTGTRIKRQVCLPNFQIEANTASARGFWETLRDHLDPFTTEGTTQNVYMSAEARIASQQKDYRRKLREVAEKYPEFLEAIADYTEVRAAYDRATMVGEGNGRK